MDHPLAIVSLLGTVAESDADGKYGSFDHHGYCRRYDFLFNSPGKNIFLNIGLGLWDSYNMATGLLGDVLSYVRLFALGLSGGILAGVFNSLAVGMSPDNVIAGPIVMVLIFVIGMPSISL